MAKRKRSQGIAPVAGSLLFQRVPADGGLIHLENLVVGLFEPVTNINPLEDYLPSGAVAQLISLRPEVKLAEGHEGGEQTGEEKAASLSKAALQLTVFLSEDKNAVHHAKKQAVESFYERVLEAQTSLDLSNEALKLAQSSQDQDASMVGSLSRGIEALEKELAEMESTSAVDYEVAAQTKEYTLLPGKPTQINLHHLQDDEYVIMTATWFATDPVSASTTASVKQAKVIMRMPCNKCTEVKLVHLFCRTHRERFVEFNHAATCRVCQNT